MTDSTEATFDLAAIRARAEAATPGPWEVDRGNGRSEGTLFFNAPNHPVMPNYTAFTVRGGLRFPKEEYEANIEFVAHSREDVPALCDEIERLQKLAGRLLDDNQRWKPEDVVRLNREIYHG